jgi:hypothetical protein
MREDDREDMAGENPATSRELLLDILEVSP